MIHIPPRQKVKVMTTVTLNDLEATLNILSSDNYHVADINYYHNKKNDKMLVVIVAYKE